MWDVPDAADEPTDAMPHQAGSGDKSLLLAAGPAVPPPPLPPPFDLPIVPAVKRRAASTSLGAVFPCILCPRKFEKEEPFIPMHCNHVHAGEPITPSVRNKFADSGRGMCSTENCDALRKSDEPYCRKCKLYADVRPFRDGDCIPSCSARPGPSQALIRRPRVICLLAKT